ncbi:hypothetical protein FOA52_011673 [Chlamydomonas sp. UWO 241]|nr:hypothetical protein FOA52_011673 [Chlamydomonas sp. UWO 241]
MQSLDATRSAAGGRCSPSGRCQVVPSERRARAPRLLTTASAVVVSETAQELKASLAHELIGLDRGIFGVPAAKKAALNAMLTELEGQNPIAAPVDDIDKIAGAWRLLYSTIAITGLKRTKLGLREFVRLGDFVQSIDTDAALAVNTISFSVAGLGLLKGSLTIKAAYKRASGTRVDIEFLESVLTPEQLSKIFEASYDMLLGIFNPQGHLDVTYLDDMHRVGRDDKGNVFYLERVAAPQEGLLG